MPRNPKTSTKLYVHEFGFWYRVPSQIHTKKSGKVWILFVSSTILQRRYCQGMQQGHYCGALEPRALLPGTTGFGTSFRALFAGTAARPLLQGTSPRAQLPWAIARPLLQVHWCQGLLPGYYWRGTSARDYCWGTNTRPILQSH
jgi:hypothetical protein